MMDSLIGQVQLFAFNFAPRGWRNCDGKMMSVATDGQLFSLIGNQNGGDGKTNFALPDLRGKSPLEGVHYCIRIKWTFPFRS